MRTEGNVAGNRFFKELIFGVLKDHAHLMAHCQGFSYSLDIRTVDGNRAVRGFMSPNLDQRRHRAGVTDDPDEFSLMNLHIRVVEGRFSKGVPTPYVAHIR